MAKREICYKVGIAAAVILTSFSMVGCQKQSKQDKTVIEIVSYKQEAVDYFEALEEKFNQTHDDIELKISSPNDAMTVLKTRFIREDNPDIIAIGGEYNFSNFMDAKMLMDISDYEGLSNIKESYLQMNENLKFVPMSGVYAVPYVANGAGILYNKDMFLEYGWEIPTTWNELLALCEQIEAAGELPFYMGYKDTWTCMSPWNAAASSLTDADLCRQVNRKEVTFFDSYYEVATQMKELLQYGPSDPVAYSYNDACTSFARGESAMYMIGSYAVPQIKSVNPEMNIGMFTYPGADTEEKNVLTSGIDLQFSVMNDCPNKEAAYEVLDFLFEEENVQSYLDDQNAIPCMNGDYVLPELFDNIKQYINQDRVADFQDHFYPSEMSVDALIQAYLLDGNTDSFLQNFDKLWVRYNRDLIQKVSDFQNKSSKELE